MRYQGYVNPHAGTVADLLLRRGEIGARSVENIGGINARAAEQRGAAWAGAAQNIGQIAAGIPMQIQKQRELDAVMRERTARARESEQRTRLERESDIAGKQGAAALAESIQRHRTDEGVDFSAVAADIAAIDPDAATKFQTLADKTADSRKKLRDARTALARESNRISAEMAANASDPGDFLATVGMYHADDLIDDDTVKKLSELVQSAGAEGWEPLKTKIVQGSPEFAAQQLETEKTKAGIQKTEAETEALKTPKTPTSFDAAILAARQAGNQAEVDRLLVLKRQAEAAGRAPQGPGSLEQQIADALRRGDSATADRLEDAARRASGARRGTAAVDESLPADYRTAAERAIMSIPAIRRGTVIETVNRLWKEGKTKELGEVIKQAAVESEPVDIRNQVRGRDFTLAALADTRAMLNDMKAAGVPTNWLVGTAENLARKLGKSTNTDYAILGNRLMSTLIQYRRAATGVQFSQREQEQYAQMFPSYKNDLPVNMALIEGLERDIRTNNESFWKAKLGEAGAKLIDAGGTAPAANSEGWTDLGNGVRIREKP